jgi:hypothetical protein
MSYRLRLGRGDIARAQYPVGLVLYSQKRCKDGIVITDDVIIFTSVIESSLGDGLSRVIFRSSTAHVLCCNRPEYLASCSGSIEFRNSTALELCCNGQRASYCPSKQFVIPKFYRSCAVDDSNRRELDYLPVQAVRSTPKFYRS